MRPIRRILIALEASAGHALLPESERAVEHALALGPLLGASEVVLHAPRNGEIPGLRERFQAAGIATASDREAPAIPERVRDAAIDLVIFGEPDAPRSHRPGISPLAKSLLRDCPCAVWAVKSAGAPVPRRVLAAADLTPMGARVVETAIDIADRCGASLDVVHTFQRPLAVQMEGEAGRFGREEGTRRRRALERQIAASGSRSEIAVHVGIDSPTHAILAYSRRRAPDLVVVGNTTHQGMARLVLGSNAERLLGRLPGSLLTLAAGDRRAPS